LNTVYTEVVKEPLAPSIKEEFRKIASHVLRNFELMPKELVLEHRLSRGCEQHVLLQELRTKKEKQLLMFLAFLNLIPKKQCCEHRLNRGCELSALL
jgi:energy-coupling factor transporter ATP-binding protein EcfA2